MAESERISLTQKLQLLPKGYESTDSDSLDDDFLNDEHYRAFVPCRQPTQRAEMLDLSFKNGQHESFSYSHLYRARLHCERGILLQFSDHVVQIQGTGLREGYRRILSRRVLQVTEADGPTVRLVGDKEAVVTKITIEVFHPELSDA